MKVKRRVTFTYTPDLIGEPVIYTLGQQFNLVTNIQEAEISRDKGWALVELEGEDTDVEQALAWAISRGLRLEELPA